jgi:succinyl-diaminopimelate desuccinylase
VTGVQGHVAYPDRAKNPVPALMEILRRLTDHRLDDGTDVFQPSNLEITNIDVGNTAVNVIPATATGRINIRFNDRQTAAGLREWIEDTAQAAAKEWDREVTVRFAGQGDAFHFEPGDFAARIADAAEAVVGRRPEYSTTGGTSDARFIKDVCPVAEFGLVGRTMHQVDERAAVKDIEDLSAIYLRILQSYFTAP